MRNELVIAVFSVALTASLGAYAADEGNQGTAPHSHLAEKGGAVSAPKPALKLAPATSSAKAITTKRTVAKHNHIAEKGGPSHATAD